MIILFLTSTLVYQNGDTLVFMKDDVILETKIIASEGIETDDGHWVYGQTRVAPDHMSYLVYRAFYEDVGQDSLVSTTITFYNAKHKKLWDEKETGNRSISYELSSIYDSILIVTTWGRNYGNPAVFVIRDGKKKQIIEDMDWQRIVSYQVSPNNRYILFHTRNPYHAKLWDYIYFYDLETGSNWEYIFPNCLSCKKARIELEVNDEGRSEVIHKNEHRVFSSGGVLEDIYMKLQ